MASQQTYEEQIEAGKEIVKEILCRLASDIEQPQVNKFSFIVTDRDFDNRQISVLDPDQKKIVFKMNEDDLADAPASSPVRHRLEAQLREAVRAYFKK